MCVVSLFPRTNSSPTNIQWRQTSRRRQNIILHNHKAVANSLHYKSCYLKPSHIVHSYLTLANSSKNVELDSFASDETRPATSSCQRCNRHQREGCAVHCKWIERGCTCKNAIGITGKFGASFAQLSLNFQFTVNEHFLSMWLQPIPTTLKARS